MSIFVAPRPAKAEKASPQGPGSGVLITEFTLDSYGIGGKQSPQRKMKKAWNLGIQVPWIALAEDAIAERFSGVEWHLEDENDEEVTDATPNTDARAALELLEKPAANLKVGAPFYRSDLWGLTSRVMGLCGSAFILLDAPEALANTPNAMVPIAPWRMTPKEDENGNLIGWYVDKTANDPGIEVSLSQILHYPLRRNFDGHFGIGNVETAMLKLTNSTALDQHLSLVLSGGGRLSGIMSPKTGVIEGDTMLQMERDWRTIVEQSDAAKRLQLVRAPVDFQKTTLTPAEMQVRDLMNGSRDDLLTIWGVPLSIVGGSSPAGLNSGETRKYDEAAIWQGPVHSRLTIFREVTQYQLLDRWRDRGATVELEIEEPEFDDDSPRYDLLAKSADTALTNAERRELIGKPPTGDPAIDNEILLPATMVPYARIGAQPDQTPTTTETVLGIAPQPASAPQPATLAAGETSDPAAVEKKATLRNGSGLRSSLTRLRANLQERYTPRLRQSVASFLGDQKREVAKRIREHASHLASKPKDHAVWWDQKRWDRALSQALGPLTGVAESVSGHISQTLEPTKAGPPGAVERVLTRGAARVTKINETTRDAINAIIAATIEAGGSVLDAADALEASATFDEYRAELIARTELMDAYNAAALGSYQDAGLTQVQAIDGDGDPECAERDGQIFDIEEADAIEDHPNGTLDWVPVIEEPVQKAVRLMAEEVKATNDDLSSALNNLARAHVSGLAVVGRMHAESMDKMAGTVSGGLTEVGMKVDRLADTPHVVNVAPPIVNVAAPLVTVPEPTVIVQNAPRERTVSKNNDGSYTVRER